MKNFNVLDLEIIRDLSSTEIEIAKDCDKIDHDYLAKLYELNEKAIVNLGNLTNN